jgi:primosomal protein N' (replication factor Y)
MLRTGTERFAEELGRSFSDRAIFLSTAEKPILELIDDANIVVATSGMEPRIKGGYSAIVLLNGEELVSRPFIRAEEEVLQRWFSTLQHLKKGGEIFVSLPNAHAISQSIIAGDPIRFLKREVEERIALNLPPAHDLIVIESKADSLAALRSKLLKEFPTSVANLSINSRRVSIMVDKNEKLEVVASLRALQKLRSINKKDLFKIAINPYRF